MNCIIIIEKVIVICYYFKANLCTVNFQTHPQTRLEVYRVAITRRNISEEY